MEATVNGTTLHYDEHGNGRPLLLIHGIGGSGLDWAGVVPRLAHDYRVIAVDVRGFGRSQKPPGPYTPAQWAADLAALLRHIGAAPAVVLGHSMGGVIAQRLLLDYAELFEAAILQSTSSQVKEQAAAYWEGQAAEIERDGLGPSIARRQAGYTEEFKREHPDVLAMDERRVRLNEPHAYAAAARAVARYNYTDALKTVRKPVLIIQGLDDTQTPPGGSVIMSRAIPGARLEMLERCGHNVMVDQPDRLVELVLGFLGEVWQSN